MTRDELRALAIARLSAGGMAVAIPADDLLALLDDARALLLAEDRILELTDQVAASRRDRDAYLALAVKHGHHATATLDKRTRVLSGSLMIAGDLLDAAKFDAIAQSCAELARKFRAAYNADRPRDEAIP